MNRYSTPLFQETLVLQPHLQMEHLWPLSKSLVEATKEVSNIGHWRKRSIVELCEFVKSMGSMNPTDYENIRSEPGINLTIRRNAQDVTGLSAVR